VEWIHFHINGEHPTGFARSLIEWWPYTYGLGFVLAIVGIEWSGYQLYKIRKNLAATTVDEAIAPVLERARIPMPAIIEDPDVPVANAAATQSILFGMMLLVVGRIRRILNSRQFVVVSAHEIGHLANGDPYAMWLIAAMDRAIEIHKYFLKAALVCLVVAIFFLKGYRSSDALFIVGALVGIWFVHIPFVLAQFAYMRSREYLADAAAIKFTGWGYAPDLVTALVKVVETQRPAGISLSRILQRSGGGLLDTHPSVPDRAAVLGVTQVTVEL
jgi:Zn-dependent protease with chaperone function